jgi:hypothetical protein
MQCGPIRHRIERHENPASEISLELVVRKTALAVSAPPRRRSRSSSVCSWTTSGVPRSSATTCSPRLPKAGAASSSASGNSTATRSANGYDEAASRRSLLEGGLGARARAAILGRIENTPPEEPLVVVATGQYLGEGFDDPQLDTLFLAFPVSFKGRLVQYSGRLMRAHEGKTSVRVYDYADVHAPVLRAMHARRLTTYKTLGFTRKQQLLTTVAA